MAFLAQPTRDDFWRELRLFTRERITRFDRPAWRRFFLALLALTLSFFLAVYSTALSEAGRIELAAWTAGLALLLTGIVAAKAVPYLARRTALERWVMKVEYRLTREGLIYLLAITILAVAALNTGNNLLFIILASLLAGILVSGMLSRIVLSDLELEFVLPEHIFAERPFLSRLTVKNLKWIFPSFSITVSGRTPSGKPSKRTSPRRLVGAAGAEPGRILCDPVYVPYIPHRSSVTQHVELTFSRRGRYCQDGFRVSSKFPFGLLGKAREAGNCQEIRVFPNVQPTEEFYEVLPLIGGETHTFYKGRGHDLYAIRDYQESDTARHVDWKATAKTQQIKVREFTREDERRLVLALDTRLPRTDQATLDAFEKAVTLCACLAWHFREIDAQMQFLSPTFETAMAPAGQIIYPVLEALAEIEPDAGPIDGAADPMLRIASALAGFGIILTCQPRGSIPTRVWESSYVIFIDSL